MATKIFASTRSVQIATSSCVRRWNCNKLCLHTLRADCNYKRMFVRWFKELCLHTLRADCNGFNPRLDCKREVLCLHTLRADCNVQHRDYMMHPSPLPPHAPYRLQRNEF